jgi:UDP-N-acetylmuramoyl-tripeptide--D-alanyl-D-alanine ligase
MTDVLWASADMAEATAGVAAQDFTATGISIDTRSLKKGETYLALQGKALDGHDFVAQAFAAGASAAIVRADYAAADAGWPLLRVDDTLVALEDLGLFARNRSTAKIIGVTGSAGKTGTKDMLATMLGGFGKTHVSLKSFNNHWGVPLSLANLPPDAAFGVFEMGMNHTGEMQRLAGFVRPHIAIITTIEAAHIEHFKSIEAIADAKAEIFTGMDAGSTVVLNADNPQFLRLKNAAQKSNLTVASFGEDDHADSRIIDCTLHADSSKVDAVVMGAPVKYKINIPGHHIAMNALAALTAVQVAGVDAQKAADVLKNAVPVEGRGNRILVNVADGAPPLVIIDESYNANPASMVAALGVLEMAKPEGEGRRIAVLGDMLELGPEGPRMHAALANAFLKSQTQLLFCCGAQMDALYQVVPEPWRGAHAKDSQQLATLVAAAVQPGDVLLIKGSKGSKMGYVIEALQALQKTQRTKYAV